MYLYAVYTIIDIIWLFVFIIFAYYTVISVFSLLPVRNVASEVKERKFAVVIPAHNEESVLSGLIDSINNSDYPKEKLYILVVADGCKDRTAEIAKQKGVSVIEKENATCKGDALEFAMEYLSDFDFDCVAVFDADNIVDREFFKEINERLSMGAKAVQGYIDAKNPYASWVANAHSVWYWITNRIIQAGRGKLGLGSRLGGTGFVLTREGIEKIIWKTKTVAEDAEYTCMLANNDVKVDYAERAIVYDEKPVSFVQSVGQRKRWAQGIKDVYGNYIGKFILKGKINIVLGMLSDALYPISFILLITAALLGKGIWGTSIGLGTLWFVITINFIIVVTTLIVDKKGSLGVFLNIFGVIIYLISWVPITFSVLFGRSQKKWYNTSHGYNTQR